MNNTARNVMHKANTWSKSARTIEEKNEGEYR